MKKIDATVIKESKYIALWVLLLSLLMQAVFLVIGKWNYTVLLGNLLSGAAGIFNFLLMGITVQKALLKGEEEAKSYIKVSQLYRLLLLAVVVAIGMAVPCFNRLSVVIAVFFPRIAIAIRPLLDKKRS